MKPVRTAAIPLVSREVMVKMEMELHTTKLSFQNDIEHLLLDLKDFRSCFSPGVVIPDIPED